MNRVRLLIRKISRTLLAFLCFLLLGLPEVNSEAPLFDKGSWSIRASASVKRTEVASSALGGKIYVVGGFSEPSLENIVSFSISRTVEVYDPVTDFWSTSTPLPVGLHHAGIATLEDKLYVIGGFTQSFFSVWHPVATVYRYDLHKDEWTELASMPTARGALGVTSSQGRLYAIGGFDGSTNPSVVEVFDPNSNTWSSVAPLPTPRDHLAVVNVGSRVFAIGGRPNLDYGRNMGTVEEYDPVKDQWHTRAEMPTPRSGITAGVIDGQIYVLGGESSFGTFATNEVYSPHENAWRTMAPMPTARHGLGSAVINQRLFVISGGTSPGGSFSNKNEVFTPPGR